MSTAQNLIVDPPTVLRKRRGDDTLHEGPRKKRNTKEDMAMLSPALSNLRALIDVEGSAETKTSVNASTAKADPVRMSTLDRIKETIKVLSGQTSLRKVDYEMCGRVRDECTRLTASWARYGAAVEAAGGEVPGYWILASHKPRWLELIAERYQAEGSEENKDKSIYWDWNSPKGISASLKLDRELEDEDTFIKKAEKIWECLWCYNPSVTAEEYMAHLSEKPLSLIDATVNHDITITVTGPPEDDVRVLKDTAKNQDLSLLTTTSKDIHPTALQLEERRQRMKKALWKAIEQDDPESQELGCGG